MHHFGVVVAVLLQGDVLFFELLYFLALFEGYGFEVVESVLDFRGGEGLFGDLKDGFGGAQLDHGISAFEKARECLGGILRGRLQAGGDVVEVLTARFCVFLAEIGAVQPPAQCAGVYSAGIGGGLESFAVQEAGYGGPLLIGELILFGVLF